MIVSPNALIGGTALAETIGGRSYFFDNGLRFECRQCGNCCTGDPGRVRISEDALGPMARLLKLSVPDLIHNFLLPSEDGHIARELSDGRCIFYNNGCKIYPARPRQCRTFPFWLKFLRNDTQWHALSKSCPGIGQGELYSKEAILSNIDWNLS
jgi:uncharacterized protein